MITHKKWYVLRKQKSIDPKYSTRDIWRVKREGWFLLGVIPIYVKDLDIQLV